MEKGRMEIYHDSIIKKHVFKEGQLAILYDNRKNDKIEKLNYGWLGSYKLKKIV
jgi:hypothetical protein